MSYLHMPPVQEQPQSLKWDALKERGGCLTVWLVVATAFNLFFGLVGSIQLLQHVGDPRVTRIFPAVFIYGSVGLQIALIAGLYGMWTWKRWGVYTVAGALLISAVMSLMLEDALRGLVIPAGQVGLLYFLMYPKWAYFK